MQRWIVIGVIALLLALGGGAFGVRSLRQSRPDKVWVPLQINEGLSIEQRTQGAADLKAKLLADEEIFVRISKDLALAEKWNLASPEQAAGEIKKRLFVEPGDTVATNGMPVPCVNIGVTGQVKEHDLLADISTRLIKEVWTLLGLKLPPGQ